MNEEDVKRILAALSDLANAYFSLSGYERYQVMMKVREIFHPLSYADMIQVIEANTDEFVAHLLAASGLEGPAYGAAMRRYTALTTEYQRELHQHIIRSSKYKKPERGT
jgi:hypothetical protein